MKFKDWTIDDLIEYLENRKSCGDAFLYSNCVTRCRGSIELYNAERKECFEEVSE